MLRTFLAATVTDAEGHYSFGNLASAQYFVEFFLPSKQFAFTIQDQGEDDAIDSDPDPRTGRTAATAYTAGTAELRVDAGLLDLTIVFGDGFETGDTSAWTSTVLPN